MLDKFVVWHVPKGYPKSAGCPDKTEKVVIRICRGTRVAPSAVFSPAWYADGPGRVPGIKSVVLRISPAERDRLLALYRLKEFDSAEAAIEFGRTEAARRGFEFDEFVAFAHAEPK